MILEETMLLVQLDDCDGTAVKDYYAEMLANGDEEKPYSGFSYTFCYIRESDGKLIGMLNLRPDETKEIEGKPDLSHGETGKAEKSKTVVENKERSDHILKHAESADFIGTVGYSVRPAERGRGYGTALLEQGLELCAMFGIKPVAVVKKDNAASIRVLEKNGFVPYDKEGISERKGKIGKNLNFGKNMISEKKLTQKEMADTICFVKPL